MRSFKMKAASALFLLVCMKNDRRSRVWTRARRLVLAADSHSTTRRAHAEAVR